MFTIHNIYQQLPNVLNVPKKLQLHLVEVTWLVPNRWVPRNRTGRSLFLGLLLLGFLYGCVTASPEKARERMTGFEKEMVERLSTIQKGMTTSEVMSVLGSPDVSEAIFGDRFRYWVWSRRPIYIVVKKPVESKALPHLRLPGRPCDFSGQVDVYNKLIDGTYKCWVESTPSLENWRDVLTRELPPEAEFKIPFPDPNDADCVAKITFSDGRVTGVYLIHPAPSLRGAFYYTVVE